MPTPQNFATRIAPDVIYNCINTGVFPSVVIAQAILESGSGTSKQAQNMNNLFGHAASALWTGKKARTVPNGHFWRVYDSVSQCIAAHINILKKPAEAFLPSQSFDLLVCILQVAIVLDIHFVWQAVYRYGPKIL